MNNQRSEYKYVAFKQINGWNVTLRNDNWEEIVLEMEMVDNQFPQVATQKYQAVNTPTPEAQKAPRTEVNTDESDESKNCTEHGVAMKKNKNGKWYHREFKNGNAHFCNGFGFDYER